MSRLDSLLLLFVRYKANQLLQSRLDTVKSLEEDIRGLDAKLVLPAMAKRARTALQRRRKFIIAELEQTRLSGFYHCCDLKRRSAKSFPLTSNDSIYVTAPNSIRSSFDR